MWNESTQTIGCNLIDCGAQRTKALDAIAACFVHSWGQRPAPAPQAQARVGTLGEVIASRLDTRQQSVDDVLGKVCALEILPLQPAVPQLFQIPASLWRSVRS
jgi:hypothetical protein